MGRNGYIFCDALLLWFVFVVFCALLCCVDTSVRIFFSRSTNSFLSRLGGLTEGLS